MPTKSLFTGLLLILLVSNTAQAQSCQTSSCPQPSGTPDYVYPGNPPSNNVHQNELFIIESGTYSDFTNVLPGATVWIKPGASWELNGPLSSMKGTLIIEGTMVLTNFGNVSNPLSEVFICHGGTLTMSNGLTPKFPFIVNPGSTLNVTGDMNMWDSEGDLDIFGTLSVSGNISFNSSIDILTCSDGSIDVQGNMVINDDNGSFTNYGTINIDGQLTLNGSSPFVNQLDAQITATQIDLNMGSSFENFGLVTATDVFNINKTPQYFNNSCSIVSEKEMNIWDDLVNDGTIYVSNSSSDATLTISGKLTQNNIVVADNFTLYEDMSGTDAYLYIYESSLQSGGEVSGTINIYDHTDSNPNDNQYFDTQYGTTGPNVTNIPFNPPSSGELGSCPQSSGIQLLPVSWLSIDAFQQGETVVVEWTTAAETENKQFEVERLNQHTNSWEHIGTLRPKSEGNATEETNYQFIDRQPHHGSNMYRIKQVDFDGIYSFSDWVFARFKSQFKGTDQKVSVYPNPTQGKIVMNYRASHSGSIDFKITDRNGITYRAFQMDVHEGLNRCSLPNLTSLPNGMYWIHVNSRRGNTRSKRIIKN